MGEALVKRLNMRGSALITVLAMVAIAAVLSAGIMTRLQVDIVRTQRLQLLTQALLSADGARHWADAVLTQDWNNFTRTNQPTDWSKQRWEQRDTSMQISAYIEDAQARFNLNNLRDPARSQSFNSLLRTIDPTISTEIATTLTKNIQAWLDNSSRTNSSQKALYTKQQPPYLPAGQLFVHSDELLLVSGINPALFEKLRPFIIALPQTTAVNINTAGATVLSSLGTGLSLENANKLILLRQSAGFYKTTEQFLSNPSVQGAQISASQITLTSDYFILHTSITKGKEKIMVDNLLKRQNVNGKIHIVLLWQQIAQQGNS